MWHNYIACRISGSHYTIIVCHILTICNLLASCCLRRVLSGNDDCFMCCSFTTKRKATNGRDLYLPDDMTHPLIHAIFFCPNESWCEVLAQMFPEGRRWLSFPMRSLVSVGCSDVFLKFMCPIIKYFILALLLWCYLDHLCLKEDYVEKL